jgi:penicillin-binding protein 1A
MRADIGAGAEKSVPKKKAAKKNSKKRSLLRRIFGFCFYWGLVLGLWAGIASICLLGFYAAQLPQSSTWKVPERPPNATILSANGHLIANRGNSGGKSIRLAQISPAIPEAVISVEDRRFYWHFGIDPIGLIRASYKNWQAGRVIEGGSTLTQQLAKNLFLKPERTFKRKMQEVVLAFWLEWKYSKKELLEIYLNRVYLGAGAYGVDAASKRYFKKPPQNVNLMEAATLAGLLKAPSRYAPSKNPKLARERASVVLTTMVNAGYISEKERHKALTTQGIKAPKIKLGSEHYAADLAMQEFQEFIGKLSEDVIIETSLDLNLQKQAEKAVSATLKKYGKRLNVTQGAMISLAPNGEVKIIIGGRNYNLSQ